MVNDKSEIKENFIKSDSKRNLIYYFGKYGWMISIFVLMLSLIFSDPMQKYNNLNLLGTIIFTIWLPIIFVNDDAFKGIMDLQDK